MSIFTTAFADELEKLADEDYGKLSTESFARSSNPYAHLFKKHKPVKPAASPASVAKDLAISATQGAVAAKKKPATKTKTKTKTMYARQPVNRLGAGSTGHAANRALNLPY